MAQMSLLRRFFSTSTAEFLFLVTIVVLIRTIGFGLYQVPTGSMEPTILVGERFFADKLSMLFKSPKRGDIIAFNDPLYQYSKNPIINFVEEYFWGPSNWTKRVIGLPGDRIKGVVEDGKPVIYINDVKFEELYVNPYPLLTLYDDEPQKVFARAQQEIIGPIMRGNKDARALESEMHTFWEKHRRQVSYDPVKPFDKQPFYRMHEKHAVKEKKGTLQLVMPGTPLIPRPEISKSDGKNHWNGSDEFYVELGPNQYWAMGDNRLGSHDSRFWGPLDGSHIHGCILFRIWSIDSRAWFWLWDLITHPIDFWSRVRLNRFFHVMT